MVVFIMGAPRAKNGAPTSRSILSMMQSVSYPQVIPVAAEIQQKPGTPNFLNEPNVVEKRASLSSGIIPIRRYSYTDAVDEGFGSERIFEICRQKEIIFQAFLRERDEMASTVLHGEVGSNILYEQDSPLSVSRRKSPWKRSRTPFTSHGRAIIYIHESSLSVPPVPCRGDLFYASLKRRSVCLSDSSGYVSPLASPRKMLPLDVKMFALIVLEEMMTRHRLTLREERLRKQVEGKEVSAFLRVQFVIRTSAHFHQTRLSSLKDIQRKELQYLRDGIQQRAKQQEEEHRVFMHRLQPVRLPPIKIPTLTSTGQSYGCTRVDLEVAKALAMEEKTWEAAGRRDRFFFPQIL
ncbi:hypothetical protein MOQ_007029 [Trypanosoma cruzi marinkellei]|uniref:Uncharacterized protein n=1 Tax=Trypanosoma cruzi marinkellei TaxID=85056 RepID=K2M2M2_TRYCR|nr:hypothetical protein MOQ_007082 [Trypanosoma cruzi marinkellei]EKF29198.1 hypothetical protein MOQ_007029 [Trypanosoma cruzi marinkellei]